MYCITSTTVLYVLYYFYNSTLCIVLRLQQYSMYLTMCTRVLNVLYYGLQQYSVYLTMCTRVLNVLFDLGLSGLVQCTSWIIFVLTVPASILLTTDFQVYGHIIINNTFLDILLIDFTLLFI